MSSKKWFIDLFAGGGGLSEGFINAGFSPVAHVEKNEDACETLKTRTCYQFLKKNDGLSKYYNYLRKDISKEDFLKCMPQTLLKSVIRAEMNDNVMPEIFNLIDELLLANEVTTIEAIIGGPPCQAYSHIGRARKSMLNDPRNTLYKLYCKVVEHYSPEFLVFENVPGLASAGDGQYLDSIKLELSNIGYEIEYRILNAADYGVLQNRKRIILCGWKKGSNIKYPEPKKITHNYLVQDLLLDLPPIKPGQSSHKYGEEDISEYLQRFQIRNEKDILTWHIARPHNNRDINIYKKAIKTWDSNRHRLKYSDLPQNLRTHKNATNFLDRFKVLASDLSASHTVTAHIAKDGHYYIHPDKDQARSITVREAARIQSFQDNYYFEGPRTSVFTQIGNAVPPLMAEAIAKAFLNNIT